MTENKHICGIGHGIGCGACVDDEEERLRVDRWHATFNAALTGYCADGSFRHYLKDSDPDDSLTSDESRLLCAKWQANAMHGPLVKP